MTGQPKSGAQASGQSPGSGQTAMAAPAAQDSASSASGGNSASSANATADDNNDETQVVPPQVATGAYLTCGTLTAADPDAGTGYFGCDALDARAARISLANVKKTFVLYDDDNKPISQPPMATPVDDVDVSWELALTTLQAGVSASLTIYDANGNPQTIVQDPGKGIDVNSLP
jgi:hypothetical protein